MPACVRCSHIKRKLNDAGMQFGEKDLTRTDNAKDLAHFKNLGYSSAPLTEPGDNFFSGTVPAEVDRNIEAWRPAQGT